METTEKVGVIVGRFQVPELTEGHRELLEYVLNKKHQLTILVLGVAAIPFTRENPLEFTARKAMIDAEYPGMFTIVPLADVREDSVWSERLDALVQAVAGEKPVVLYGSRDSFAKHYTGRYDVDEFKQHIYCSGTEERSKAGHMHGTSGEFRRGCVYATQGQYPTSYQTVDMCVLIGDEGVLLGRKKTDPAGKWRMFGGFVDTEDACLEDAVKRELYEETHIKGVCPEYLASFRIDDWRYSGLSDRIMTALFWVRVPEGTKYSPGDDIDELRRFASWKDITEDDIVPEHVELFRRASPYTKTMQTMHVATRGKREVKKDKSKDKNSAVKKWRVNYSYILGIRFGGTMFVEATDATAAVCIVTAEIESRGATDIECVATLVED